MPNVYVNARTTVFDGGTVVASVDVRLFNASLVQVGAGITDANGDALLGSHAAATYEIRIFPPVPNAAADTVQTIVVPDSVADQYFDVYVTANTLPQATDSNLCRCSGYFKDPYGQPIEGQTIEFGEGTPPQLLHYSAADTTHAVIPRRRTITTDANGYAVVDLLRDREYEVFLGGLNNVSRTILVPDALAAPLPDVLYPYVDRLEYKDAGVTITPVATPALAMTVADVTTLTIDTFFRSGLKVAGAVEIEITSSDEDVLTIDLSVSTEITLTAVASGNATVQFTRTAAGSGYGIAISPAVDLRGELAVTVSS